MGIFDIFKKKSKKPSGNTDVGWNAICAAFEKAYPGQTNPMHMGALIGSRFAGGSPLDGISVYDGGDYWHFVTFGLSELYEKESDDPEYSGYGMEFTFKLKKSPCTDTTGEINCICNILLKLAGLTVDSGEIFDAYEYVYTQQTTGIDAYSKSALTGFITVPDSVVDTIDTPNGKVSFVCFIGATDAELRSLYEKTLTVKQLYGMLKNDITDYGRASLI